MSISPATLRSRTPPGWLTGAMASMALCAGLALTAVGVNSTTQRIQANAQARFDNHAARLEQAVKSRFDNVLTGFFSLRAFMEASKSPVDRQAFGNWVAARDMQAEFPGVRGIGFIERVQRDDLSAFIANERADHAPTFSVHGGGVSPDLLVIKYIEPLQDNQPAWGFDVGSEYTRRAAATRAATSGEPALTAHITLVQDGKKRPGFLYFLPIYHLAKGQRPATPAEREAALRGWVYAPIVLEELVASTDSAADKLLDFEVFDGLAQKPEFLVYARNSHPACTPGRAGDCDSRSFAAIKQLSIGGRTLSLVIGSTPAFEAMIDRSTPHWTAVGGILLSSLLSALIWLMGSGRARAVALAEAMTQDLRAAKRQLETALRDSNALLSTLNQHAIVSTADRAGRIQDVNAEFCRISGYSREELLGQDHRIVNSGTHPPEFWRAMWATIRSGTPWRGIVCNRAKDGHLYWVDTFIAPFVDQDGRVEKYISIRTDITRAKADAQQLQEDAQRFALAIEGGNDGLWDWVDVRRNEEWWSPQLYRLLGYEPGEIEAGIQSFNNLLQPDQVAFLRHATKEALAGSTPFDLECALRTKRGEYRWFHARAKVYRDAQGRAQRMAGSLQDIHEQRLAKEQLRTHSEQLGAIFSLSPDGFVSFDPQRRVNYVSPAFTRLTGLAEAQVSGLGEAQFARLVGAQCAQGGRPLQDFDALRRRDSEAEHEAHHRREVIDLERPAKRVLEIGLRQGRSPGISQLLHLRDVTHETEVDQLKSEFLSTAAHELRTPMASIYGFSELMMTRTLPPDRQKDVVAIIHRQTALMISIVNELLDLARIEARRGKDFALEDVDLRTLAEEVMHDFKPPHERPAPQAQLPSEPLPVRVDRSKMAQALGNVLSNAYKYSPEGGAVRLCIVRDAAQSRVGIEVADEGIGMTPDQLERVSERFYRADTSGSIPGTGLGMSIVKEIVELLGGSLQLASEFGRGTTVTLWLPLATVGEAVPA